MPNDFDIFVPVPSLGRRMKRRWFQIASVGPAPASNLGVAGSGANTSEGIAP